VTSFLGRIFPARVDNRYRGHALGLWLFIPVTVQKVAMSLTHLLKADGGAQSLSAIPLDTYSPSAAQNIVGLFARMGLEQLMLAALLLLVLLRYRAMIPLMYVVIVTQHVASRIVGELKPLVRAGESGVSTPILAFFILSVIGLMWSLIGRGYREPAGPALT
jgi:hypothetical protein